MAKKLQKSTTASTEPKGEQPVKLTNRQLQAAIEGINSLIAQKIALATRNAFTLMGLATVIESAFKPGAKLLDEYGKEMQERAQIVIDRVKAESGPDITELDEVSKKELDEIQSDYNKKVTELMDIEVEVVFTPIAMNIFKNREGKDIDIELRSVYAFMPFMKGE